MCQFVEENKEQCSQYFSMDNNDWKEYGSIKVKVVDGPKATAQLRKVLQTKLLVKRGKKKHEVSYDLKDSIDKEIK